LLRQLPRPVLESAAGQQQLAARLQHSQCLQAPLLPLLLTLKQQQQCLMIVTMLRLCLCQQSRL
jgi:hypothetical protein